MYEKPSDTLHIRVILQAIRQNVDRDHLSVKDTVLKPLQSGQMVAEVIRVVQIGVHNGSGGNKRSSQNHTGVHKPFPGNFSAAFLIQPESKVQ